MRTNKGSIVIVMLIVIAGIALLAYFNIDIRSAVTTMSPYLNALSVAVKKLLLWILEAASNLFN